MPDALPDDPSPDRRTIELTIEFAGGAFAGWQIQPDRRTVAGEVQRAAAEILREPVHLVAASRTDAGVHALGQVASFSTANPLEPRRILRGLNALLPADVAVIRVREMPADFHARFSARGKHYRYRILERPAPSPWEADRVWHLGERLDLAAMQAAAVHLEGEHDFRALASRPDGEGDCTRRLLRVGVSRAPGAHGAAGPELLLVDVVGDAFLYKMVRTIVGTLCQVGRGKRPASSIPALLAAGERRRAGPTAPPEGLTLVRVFYSDAELTETSAGGESEDHHHGPRCTGPRQHAGLRRGEGREARALPR